MLICAAQGLAGLSVQWGAWAEGGMAAANAGTVKAVERMGMGMIAPEQGICAVEGLLLQAASAAPAVAAAVPFVWPRFIQRLGGAVPPMFADFALAATAADAPPAPTHAAQPGRRSVRGKAGAPEPPGAGVSAEAQRASVLDQVQEAVASVLGGSVGMEDPLMAAGLDSLGTGVSCQLL